MASAKKSAAKKSARPYKSEREPGMMSGNLASDPEFRFTANGTPVGSLYVAVNERIQNDDGEWEDTPTEFHDVTVWRQQAERVVENLQKGDRIVAIGYWETRSFENKDGDDVTKREFTAQELGPSLLFRDAAPVRSKVTRTKGKSEPPF